MRYALYRRHSPTPTKQAEAPAKRRPKHARVAARHEAAPEHLPPPPALNQTREISLGSNEGIRTVKLRRSTVVWQKPKKIFAAADAPPAETGGTSLHTASQERRPLLSVKKLVPA